MRELCLSSELYPVSPADIAALADTPADLQQHVKDEITVLIGDSQSGQTDTLLSGRDAVRRALAENASSVPVRFAFFSKIGRFDFITVERNIRTKENAYVFSNPLFYYDEAERKRQYDELYNSMKRGYDDNFPLDVMLLRMMGIKDTVNQGHHRMGIAIECKLPLVAVRFSAAGAAPRILQPLLKVIADINITLKLWNKNK